MLSVLTLILGCTSTECCIQECHGLEISCGPNVPKACTAIYMLGDFCRSYASCNESCMLVESSKFLTCKACVTECNNKDSIDSFDCENTCRQLMNTYCEIDSDCACGKDIEGNCFIGSKELVNTSDQCPDYCTGIAGNLEIKCINNTCTQV